MLSLPAPAPIALPHADPMLGLTLADIGDNTLVLAILGMVTLIIFMSIVIGLPVRGANKDRREREQTKREIAAYAAEGSITPDEAARMIQSAEKGKCDFPPRGGA